MIDQRLHCLRCGHSLAATAPAAVRAPAALRFVADYRWWLAAIGVALLATAMRAGLARQDLPESAVAATADTMNQAPQATNPEPASRSTTEQMFLDPDRGGTGAFARGDFSSAIALYREAIEKNPNDLDSLNNLGLALVRVGRPAEAIPYFERAIQLNQTNWGPKFNLATAYSALNDWANAISAYRAASAALPNDYVTLYNLGLALHKVGDEEAAITEFRRAAELAPGEPSFHLSLGISYERLKRPSEAVQAYEDYLNLAPDAADAAQIRLRIQTLKNPA
jgi:Flp pilus assembly protein TadD